MCLKPAVVTGVGSDVNFLPVFGVLVACASVRNLIPILQPVALLRLAVGALGGGQVTLKGDGGVVELQGGVLRGCNHRLCNKDRQPLKKRKKKKKLWYEQLYG